MESIRSISKKVVVFPATEIPLLGFGTAELTGRIGNALHTEDVLRMYKLRCGCLVKSAEECGSVCIWCREDVKDFVLGVECMTEEQLDWSSTPCRRHFRICHYPFCSIGLCDLHAFSGNGCWTYCPEHFELLQDELEKIVGNDPEKSSIVKLMKSFFFK